MTEGVLGVLPASVRASALGASRRRRFRPGEVVFHQGDPSDSLFVIAGGHACVRVATPTGHEVTLAVLGPGDEFGELALLRPAHRHTATVVALDDVEVLTIDRDSFDRLRQGRPEVAAWLIDVLARRVEALSELVAEAMFLSADRRVIRRLLDVTLVYPDGERPDVPLTQQEIATLAGISRPTANQILRRLAERGLIRLGRGRLTVLDRAGLLRAAGWVGGEEISPPRSPNPAPAPAAGRRGGAG